MSIPKYDEIMLPLLAAIKSGDLFNVSDLTETLADQFKLSEEELRTLLPSGKQAIFRNRVGWAKTYLKKAGLLDSPERGTIKITERGLSVLKENLKAIDKNYLMNFEEFKDFQNISKESGEDKGTLDQSFESTTPEEIFEDAYRKMNTELASELLDKILDGTPFFFEKIVVDLLINMGYGGSKKDAGQAFSTSGDGGIDGIVKEDRLGLDVIYVQAKRWKRDSCVGRPEIQKFAGALQGARARKGVFITTSYFSKDAMDYVANIDSKIILIDGKQLATYMIESNTGVATQDTYYLKKIDLDYFQED